MARALTLLGLLALSACGPTLASPCARREDCGQAQSCFQAPLGFCGHGCTVEGDQRDCPGGTLCTFFGGSQLVCSTACLVDGDCRADYACAPVQGTSQRACRPVGVAR